MNMNSGFSKFEKSIEECINYDFDDDLTHSKTRKRSSRLKSKDLQLNGKVSNGLTNWLKFKENYSWLYIRNSNPKCSFCEQAIKDCPDMIVSCWTNPESPLDNNDSSLDEEKILKMHANSDNHNLAYHFMVDNSLIEGIDKSERDLNDQVDTNKNEIPNFMDISEWDELQKKFSWLYYKQNVFRCLICEEGFIKERKLMCPTPWTCPERMKTPIDPSQKSLRSNLRFEKHQLTNNHENATKVVSDNSKSLPIICSPISMKDENKPSKKSIVFSPPNVTTRTAIRKSLCDRNSKPQFMDDETWNSYKLEFPWIYFNKNALRCTFCEDAYKNHNDSMQETAWTNPDSIEDISSEKQIKSKYRLTRHEKNRNHELAVELLASPKTNVVARKSTEFVEKEKENVINEPEMKREPDLIPATVRSSRKSAPVKLVYEEKTESYEKVHKPVRNIPKSQIQIPQKIEPEIDDSVPIPAFLSRSQFHSLKSRYSWFTCTDKTYGCFVCMDAARINSDILTKSQFASGIQSLDSDWTYFRFRKKLYRHSESKVHTMSLNNFGNEPESSHPPVDVSSPDSRFTRLKSGTKGKIDYKRMSEGFTQNEEVEYSFKREPEPIVPKKRKESSVTWMCPQCKSHFCNTDDLLQHIGLCDYQSSDSSKVISCPCNTATFRFNTITKLDLHAAQEHDTQSYFHCYICSDRYNRLSLLYHHMLIHHLITWDPFEAYLPAAAIESFVCLFCSSSHRTNLLLSKHYIHSTCNQHFQTSVILQDISPLSSSTIQPIQEEVTILDVEELPEDKDVIYSPVPKSKNLQHNRISRNHPLRRFGPTKKTNPKEQLKKVKEVLKKDELENIVPNAFEEVSKPIEIENKVKIIHDGEIIDSKIAEIMNNSNVEEVAEVTKINETIIDSEIKEIAIDSSITQPNNELNINIDFNESAKSVDDYTIGLKLDQSNKILKINELESNVELKSDASKIDLKPDESKHDLKNNQSDLNIKNELKSNTPAKNSKVTPKVQSKERKNKVICKEIISKISESINNNLKKKKSTLLKSNKSVIKGKRGRPKLIDMSQIVDLNNIITEKETKKLMIEVNHCNALNKSAPTTPEMQKLKKQPIKIQSQLSPCKKLKTVEREDEIPAGLSFMDRMKKIRQLKKIRTEQQREQMMAVEQKIAEINEKSPGGLLVNQSDRIRKLLNSEQYSMKDLKNIIQIDHGPKPEKRKHVNSEHHPDPPPKQIRTEPPKPTSSPNKHEQFPCQVCEMKFKSFRARDNHTTTDHKGLKLFSCKVCDLSFTTHILLRKHAHKYHLSNMSFAVFGKRTDSDTNFLFQCTFCPLQFTSRSGLNHHVTSGHKTEPDTVLVLDEFLNKLFVADSSSSPQSCLICQETIDNEFELEIHTIEHQKECLVNEISEPTQFACPKCCRLFFGRDGKSYLKDHYNIVHLEKPLPSCEECETKFASTVCYSLHRKSVKNCSKKTADQLKIDDPYEKLNDLKKLAFVCSRCQTLVAGESAETRFEQHKTDCNAQMSIDELLVPGSQPELLVPGSQPESVVLGSQPESVVPSSQPESVVLGSQPESVVPGSQPESVEGQ